MPLIKTNTTGMAVGDVVNPWQGNQYEFLPFDAMIEVALLADAGDTMNASVYSGSDVLLQNSEIDAMAVTTPITYPDDYSLEDDALAGERLGCEITNLGIAAGVVRTAVRISPQ